LLNTFTRQVCFRKVKNYAFDDINDSENDENAVSVDDLLARAASDPDSDTDGGAGDDERGSPLSTDSMIAPANTIHRYALRSVFYDAARAARDRHRDGACQIDQPLVPPPSLQPTPLTASTTSTLTEPTRSRSETLAQSPEHPTRSTQPTVPMLAGVNLNGKRPRTRESQDDLHEEEHSSPPVIEPRKRPRGGGVTGRGRGRGRTWLVTLLSF